MSWGERLLGLEGRTLILASASPRRASLLEGIGVPFQRMVVDVNEALEPGESPAAAAERLAERKALAAWHDVSDAVVLAADTLVAVDDTALGKPANAGAAREMLARLSGRSHTVVTGVAVMDEAGDLRTGVASTAVRFRDLSGDDMEALVASGEARDKAGAYGIQGLASLMIEGIEGDYYNVVGLPLGLVRRLLIRKNA